MNKQLISTLREQSFRSCKGYEGGEFIKTNDAFTMFTKLVITECIAEIQKMEDQVNRVGPPPGYDYDTFMLAYEDCKAVLQKRFGIV